jgi:hypothetical protein
MLKTNLRIAAAIVFCTAVPLSAQSLPAGWTSKDIGAVGSPGSSDESGGTFSVTGDGADIWGSADAFQFAYMTFTGDGEIVARVASVEAVNNWTKAGVMMRETLSAGSRHAFMIATPARGLVFQRRPSTNGASTSTPSNTLTAPVYVKLTRSGNTFTAYRSADGVSWTTVGSELISMAPTIYVGLAVTSHSRGIAATAVFDSVRISSAVPSTRTVETMVFFRHGEKPSGGYGQLTCQGLQRALALHSTLTRQFGTPHFLFAPNPIPKVTDPAGSFYYVRPLATIEPTAIRLGMPVNAQYGHTDVTGLQTELVSTKYASATVFISWEHVMLQRTVQNLMNQYGGGFVVPEWPGTDYDSIFIVRLTRDAGVPTATFEHGFEGLNGMSTMCP